MRTLNARTSKPYGYEFRTPQPNRGYIPMKNFGLFSGPRKDKTKGATGLGENSLKGYVSRLKRERKLAKV